MLFRRSDVPLDRDASGRFLPWLVAIMVYLAALALVCAMAINGTVGHWEEGLSGRLTIQVPRAEAANAAAGTAETIDHVIELLLATSGVTSAEVLEPDEISRLLEPWLGAGASSPDLPVPALIAVTLDPTAKPDLERLAAELARAAPGAVVDDHQAWLGRFRDLARSVQLTAAVVVLLVGACAVMIVVFATRMGLSIHGDVIELLHLIGAQDSYVARQFQAHALKLALRGGVLGLLLAGATVMLLGRMLERAEAVLLPEFSLRALEWSMVALLPLIVALVAMLTARLTVLRTLGRMP
ncbi:MAG: cell division protein FtsX [Kiloniellaceae bacterium]